jgi:stage II sporulation protein D
MHLRLTRLLALAALGFLLSATAAHAASRLTIRGAGFGHGVGMSQYGAMGYAEHGAGYGDILAHYYTGTSLGTVEPTRVVRVLLQSTSGAAAITSAERAGTRTLDPAKSYRVVRRTFDQVDLQSATGRKLGTYTAPLQIDGGADGIVLKGRALNGRTSGAYRGILELRPGAFGVNAINAVALDEYVQGVVPVESPASWPLEALKAQAVAARTYAITSTKGGNGFEHYPDTRSQVYGGMGVEQPTTNQAVAETARQVVTYEGRPVTTYFFSTSGGRTENNENSFGGPPQPWLRSVEDPYDDVSPRHRWRLQLSMTDAARKLSGLVKGRFRGVKVVRRGASPRVVAADIVGTRGTTRVTGSTLRARFGLFDTWGYYTSIATKRKPPAEETPAEQPPQRAAGEGTGGVTPAARMTRFRAIATVTGTVLPARDGERVTIQVRRGPEWVDVIETGIHDGAYRAAVTQPGVYRALYRGASGAPVRVR